MKKFKLACVAGAWKIYRARNKKKRGVRGRETRECESSISPRVSLSRAPYIFHAPATQAKVKHAYLILPTDFAGFL